MEKIMGGNTLLEVLNRIVTRVLQSLYEPFGFAVIMSLLFMCVVLFAKEQGWKELGCKVWSEFKHSVWFRKMFVLTFYVAMILFRTLLNREMWMNPISDVMGGWTLHNANGDFTTESIENVMLFLPFAVLLFWTVKEKLLKKGSFLEITWKSIKITFLFSASIEFLQLILRLGTIQLSDLCYNTLGGLIGGIIYWIGSKLIKGKKHDE